ncbi:hypothetical protein MCOR22_000210 [Pyricularia oryzae]|nr:hypothetical protein MCOR22_000210 [Pyricularia oryzae]
MERFQSMHPTDPDAAAKYRIRDRKSWTEVFDQLEAAKVQCYQTKGFKGGFRKIYRKSGDHVQPCLGAAKHAAQVHQVMSGAFDGIEPMFSQIELFLKTYPGDENIKQASIALIAVNFHAVECPSESGTTHFCTKLIEHIAEHPRHMSLNFFCGQHLEPCNPHSGGLAMVQTFLCQLLNQCDFGPQYQVNQELELIRAGDVKKLYRMFESLFSRIDASLCVFCIIDGVVFYERDEFLQDLGDVIPMIVKLSAEHDTHMPILKFLIASPTKTSVVRRLFTDDQIFSMTTMSEYIEDPSPMRVERRLKEEESGSSFGL